MSAGIKQMIKHVERINQRGIHEIAPRVTLRDAQRERESRHHKPLTLAPFQILDVNLIWRLWRGIGVHRRKLSRRHSTNRLCIYDFPICLSLGVNL